MTQKHLLMRVIVLDYWIDRKNKKAYCLHKFPDILDKDKKSNIYLAESNYYDK